MASKLVIREGVTEIREGQHKHSKIEELVLPSTLKKIGKEAFALCYNLKKVVIPDNCKIIGEEAFYDCSSLECLDLGKGLKTIKNKAFSGCDKLKELVIPDSVEIIGNWAFALCGITSLKIGGGVKKMGNGAFHGNYQLAGVTISDGVEVIGIKALEHSSNLKSIDIPASVKSVGKNAFWDCPAVGAPKQPTPDFEIKSGVLKNYSGGETDVVIPDGIEKIAYDAFFRNDKIKTVKIPPSVTYIDPCAFFDCPSLENFTVDEKNAVYRTGEHCIIDIAHKAIAVGLKNTVIPDDGSIKTIGENAFATNGYAALVIPDCITKIERCAFAGCGFKELILPPGIKYISRHAFHSCSALETAVLPEGVKSIGTEAFAYCESLKSIKLPESLRKIGERAFYLCKSLKDLQFPRSLASIDKLAFCGCESLKNVDIPEGVEVNPYAFDKT